MKCYYLFMYTLLAFQCSIYVQTVKAGVVNNIADEESAPNSDYNDYGDFDESPAEQRKPTDIVDTGKKPFFDKPNRVVEINNTTKVTLDCPVRQYNESIYHILWYKDKNPISNGLTSLNTGYTVDEKFNLIIDGTIVNVTGDYYCTIMPIYVRQHVLLTYVTSGQMNVSGNLIYLMLFSILLIIERVVDVKCT